MRVIINVFKFSVRYLTIIFGLCQWLVLNSKRWQSCNFGKAVILFSDMEKSW